jgi:hypothetical protein
MHHCWLCGQPVTDPPQVIGHLRAMTYRVAHQSCLRILGELELDLRAEDGRARPRDTTSGPGRP